MIDKDRTYRTRDGREVRIYATDGGPNKMSVHGAINYGENWQSCSWHSLGAYYADSESEKDLIEVRPRHKRTVWVNVYPNHFTHYETKKQADERSDQSTRIACIKVE